MANKRKGQLTVTGEWRKHLRPLWRRAFWKQERQAGREHVAAHAPGHCDGAPEPLESRAATAPQPRMRQDSAVFVAATPVLASLDIGRSVEFFVAKIGFTKAYADPGAYGIVTRGPVAIHFWACSDRRIAEATSCRIRVEGIDELHARCLAEGIVHPNAPLQRKPWGTVEFAVLDPDGNLVTFHELRPRA